MRRESDGGLPKKLFFYNPEFKILPRNPGKTWNELTQYSWNLFSSSLEILSNTSFLLNKNKIVVYLSWKLQFKAGHSKRLANRIFLRIYVDLRSTNLFMIFLEILTLIFGLNIYKNRNTFIVFVKTNNYQEEGPSNSPY